MRRIPPKSVGKTKKRPGKTQPGRRNPKLGGIQSISRSYYASLIPQGESGEYFGFYNMFGRAGAFMGPALVAIFVTFFQDTRFGLIPIAALFIMGAIILLKVKSNHESL